MQDSEQTIFLRAIEIPTPAERARYLDEACRDDPSLRSEVEALLAARERLARAASARPVSTEPAIAADLVLFPSEEGPGVRIGQYKLLELIGEGGMGSVYMAEQLEPVRRSVALKVIRPWLDSRQVVARFEVERQVLALMDHPNIARILDAGSTESGRPYVVMDLVKGVPITRFCDEHRLTPRQRLELFIPVCEAVQHAHQKGIVHRDLKPTNILVGLYDGKPVPKVIDFGVAKAIGMKLTEHTLFTNYGMVIGTPEYMSPEQAQLDNVDVDTRTDLYSLGVVLYELLTGSTPLDRKLLKSQAILDLLQAIREQEPPKPSARLATTVVNSSVAANRGVEPRRLSGLVRGDIDWIVMKCLEKERKRRYESAAELAADLRRHLDDEPVLACPPSPSYRVRKFASRHRGAVAATALFALMSGSGIVAAGTLLWREKNAAQALNVELQDRNARLKENQQFFIGLMDDLCMNLIEERVPKGMLPSKDEEKLLDRALKAYDKFATVNQSESSIRKLAANANRRAASILLTLQRYPEAKTAASKAIAFDEELAAEDPRDCELRLQISIDYGILSSLELAVGEYDEARGHVDHAMELLASFEASDVPELAHRYYWSMGHGHNVLGEIAHRLGAPAEAEAHRSDAVDFLAMAIERAPTEGPVRDLYLSDHLGFMNNLADLLNDQGRWADAAEIYRKVIVLATGLLSGPKKQNADALEFQLAYAHSDLSELTDGEESKDHAARSLKIVRRIVSERPGRSANRKPLVQFLRQEALVLKRIGDDAGATRDFLEAVEIASTLARDYPDNVFYSNVLSSSRSDLAAHFWNCGHDGKAKDQYLEIIAEGDRRAARYPGSLWIEYMAAMSCFNFGTLLFEQGLKEQSAERFKQAVDHFNRWEGKTLNAGHDFFSWFLATCPDPRFRDPARAVEISLRSTASSPGSADAWLSLGAAQYRSGDWNEAVRALTEAVRLARRPDSSAFYFLAMARSRLGETQAAVAAFDRADREARTYGGLQSELRRFRAEAEALLVPRPSPGGASNKDQDAERSDSKAAKP